MIYNDNYNNNNYNINNNNEKLNIGKNKMSYIQCYQFNKIFIHIDL